MNCQVFDLRKEGHDRGAEIAKESSSVRPTSLSAALL